MTEIAEAAQAQQQTEDGALATTQAGLAHLVAVAPIANASDIAYESIRRALVEGRFAAGERLREVALAHQLGVSPTPVREALARLRHEGLIESEPRRGAVVPRLGPADVVEVYELRELIEGFAARRAASRHDQARHEARVGQLEAIVLEADRFADREHTPDYSRLDSDLHEALVEMAENKRMLRVFRSIRAQVQAVRLRAMYLPGRPLKGHMEHRRIVAAIRDGDPRRAESEVRRHIAAAKAVVLAWLATGAVRPAAGR